MDVRRVETQGGSHIEPPLRSEWSELEKLRWKAAVTSLETGFALRVDEDQDGEFVLSGAMFSYGGSGFEHLWAVLNGVALGALREET
jgi:hypothetical protein